MRKFISLLLAGAMIASTMLGTTIVAHADDDVRVAMITDYGDITDQSFNQTTYEACQAWCQENGIDFTYKKPATDADADRESSMEEAIEDGYNVIVMPGYAFAVAIVNVAPTYPDVKFVALDVSEYDLNTAAGGEFAEENVYSAVYQEELAGYMAGYAAVKLGYKKLGFLGGMAVPAVIRYGFGFVQGADDAAAELGLSDVELKYVYGGQFFGDADITSVMDTWYQGGTEVVFACGGGIYSSAAEAAAWDDYKGQVQNLGLVSENPDENYVQLPASTQWADGFTEDDYKALVAKMFSGEIEVDANTETMPAVEAITVDDQGAIKG